MGFNENYQKLRKKRLEEEEKERKSLTVEKPLFVNKTAALYESEIAPVAEPVSAPVVSTKTESKEEEKKRKWFEKGAFEDGYQFGDITKTIFASDNDLANNVTAGILGIGEKVVDAGAYAVGGVAGLFGNDELKDKTQDFIKKDLYDEQEVAKKMNSFSPQALTRKLLGVDTEEQSVFGEKTDSLAQSGGQLLGTVALQSVGVPWYVTSGVTSFGSEVETAFNEDATYLEAGLSGAISAGAEILTEKLFGGSGLGEKGLIKLDLLTEGISKKVVKSLVDFGLDMVAEGSEEIVSSVFNRLASSLYKEENLKDLLLSEEAFDEYVESFVGGMVLGGGMNVGNVTNSIQSGRDYRTGLTENEQKVVDKIYNDRVAEESAKRVSADAKDGKVKGLSEKERAEIYNSIVEEMEKGYISTDTIEEVLGGDTFKSYQDAAKQEQSILSEYEELGKKTTPTLAEQHRYSELHDQVKEINENSKSKQLKSQLRSEVFGLVGNDRLVGSYIEGEKRREKFHVDLADYDEKEQAVVQKAIDSGVLNNTSRTHEFVGMVAKISADKGVLFDFTNNEKLKESGFAVEGKNVNGFVTKDGVTVNINSQKALNSVVGHEITHVLEGTELYTELQSALFEYAKTKKDFAARRTSIEALYRGIEGADVDAELTADLVGDYLFTDADFVKNLSTNHRNVFQKIYDEIKYLVKVATAGSKEARELERVKKAFDKAYKANSTAKGDTKYSLDMVEPIKPTSDKWAQSATTDEVRAKHPTLYAVDETATEKRNPTQVKGTVGSYRNIYESLKAEGFNGTILDASSGLGYGTKVGVEEYGFKVDDIEPYPDSNYKPKYTDYSALDKTYDVVISNAVLNVLPQDQRDALVVKMGESLNPGGRMFVNVRGKDVLNSKNKVAINEANMEYFIPRTEKTGSYQKGFTVNELKAYLEDALGDGYKVEPTNILNGVSVIVTKDGGAKYSLSDSDGKQLTKEQSEYFKDSKVRDDNGNLKVVYHGSPSKFTVFEHNKINAHGNAHGRGFYFTDNKSLAEGYEKDGGQLLKGYLNIEKPLSEEKKTIKRSDVAKLVRAICEAEAQKFVKDGEYQNVKEALRDTFVSNYVYTYGMNMNDAYKEVADIIYDDCENDVDIISELTNGGAGKEIPLKLTHELLGYDGVIYTHPDGTTHEYVSLVSNQFKNADNLAPTENVDIRRSLSEEGITQSHYGNYNIFGSDVRLERQAKEVAEPIAPITDKTANDMENGAVKPNLPINDTDYAPMVDERSQLEARVKSLQTEMDALLAETKALGEQMKNGALTSEEYEAKVFGEIRPKYNELAQERQNAKKRLASLDTAETDSANSLTDADAPPEMDAPFYGESEEITVDDPFEKRDIKAVGNPKTKAYMYENPEVKPFFQAEANIMLGELRDTTKGERWAIKDDDGYIVDWGGVKRNTSMDIAYLLDNGRGNGRGYTYDEIEAGLKAIIEDNGKENNACSKRIEFLLNDRLLKGNVDFQTGLDIPPNQDYINLLNEKQITEYNEEAFGRFMENADQFAPVQEDVTRVQDGVQDAPIAAAPVETATNEAPIKETKQTEPKTDTKTEKTAKIIYGETEKPKRRGLWSLAKEYLLDNGMVFEGLAKKTKNRELEARWNSIRYSDGKAQNFIKNGKNGAKSIEALRNEVERAGLTKAFDLYIYHKHNVDRMSLESRVAPKIAELREQLDGLDDAQIAELAQEPIKHKTPKDEAAKIRSAREYTRLIAFKNKPVFGDTVTAEVSQANVDRWEKQYPVFKKWADEVYANNKYLRQLMVDEGLITQETAELWDVLYPHYVPIRRKNHEGAAINVPLDSNKTGVNAPIKRATGGNSDFYSVFETMGTRAMQTYKAIAKNRFGVELMNTLGTTISQTEATLDDAMNVDAHDELLKEGKNGMSPTFTIFEDGKRVEFEITNEMYDALRPAGDALSYTNPVLNKLGNLRRALLTSHNPTFMITNPIKDSQDILINSQHPVKTYWNLPQAAWQMLTKGEYYGEYMENGGEDNTYFEKDTNTFKKERSGFVKALGFPLNVIDKANNFVERLPRLAEYMASRKDGRSIDVSMLDAARVTTNFAAGGKLTKLANRNGVTFLNASVQGAVQQVRNVQEAKMNGLKGWVGLAAKVTAAGLPALLLNHLLWDDDEEYEELSDYVKDNYYIVAKTEDGHFVRIPKGRAVAVIQNAFEQMENLVTGNDEVDFGRFFDLVKTNLAPNSVTDNNLISPIMQVNKNEAWYGEDLVPTRLQDLPEAEQFDESTDSLSKWLGEKLNYSPYKINYLLDQYGGGVSDMVLPMLTPDAERGDGNMITAPFLDKFTTDPTMKNQTVSDFYTKVDELTVNANSAKATDEDILKSKYMNSINSELGELYGKKREIQNSDLSDAEKYAAVREIQEQINALTKDSLDTYNSVNIDGGYATVGDRHYRMNKDGEWEKITDKQLEKQEDVTKGLGIDASEYWSNKDEYDFAYDYPEKYAFFEENGITYDDYDSADEDGKRAYSWAAENPEKYTLSKAVTDDLFEYRRWSSELYDIKADKDENGESISGSAKEKKRAYIFGLDLDYGQKAILYRSLYDSKDDKAEFNMTIVNYLNSREDISYEQMVAILTELDFKVNGQYITW